MSRITRIGPKPAPLLAVRAEQSAIPLRDRRPESRAGFAAQFEQTAAYLPTFTEIVTEEPAIPADAGQPDVPVRTYRPRERRRTAASTPVDSRRLRDWQRAPGRRFDQADTDRGGSRGGLSEVPPVTDNAAPRPPA